jgi:drug/metabolite transporter (DMT)-like permease
MRLSLLTHAIRRGVWLLGFAFMVSAFVFQAFALHSGRLSVVQPILTVELLFLVFILGTYFGFPVTMREWIGASAIATGLAGFLFFSDAGGGEHVPSNQGWAVVGGIAVALITSAVVATRWGPRWWKAGMFGAAGAMSFAFTAALIKSVSDYATHDWASLPTHWETYGLILFGLAGLFLTQNAYHAGPLAASQTALILVDPLFSILIGVALYGDSLRTSGPWGPLEAISLLLMFVGAVVLSHSPLVTGMRGDGKGTDHEELLSHRTRAFATAQPEAEGGLPPVFRT